MRSRRATQAERDEGGNFSPGLADALAATSRQTCAPTQESLPLQTAGCHERGRVPGTALVAARQRQDRHQHEAHAEPLMMLVVRHHHDDSKRETRRRVTFAYTLSSLPSRPVPRNL